MVRSNHLAPFVVAPCCKHPKWRLRDGLLLHVSPTYNVLRHMYIVLPDDLAKGKRLVGGIVPVVTVVVVDPVVIVVAGVV